MNNDVSGNQGPRSIDAEVTRLLDLAAALQAMGVREAVTEAGERYLRGRTQEEVIVAARDVIVKQTAATVGVLVARPGAAPDAILADLAGFTQQMRGAVVGHSQSWVSGRGSD